jgi:hypothetical protein
MNRGKLSGYECFDRLIAALQAEGQIADAQTLHTLLHEVAWTTSSELLGELGLEVIAIRKANPAGGTNLGRALDDCLAAVKRVWPSIGR